MSISKINVLQVSSSRVFGGAEEHVRTLVKYLDREAFDIAAAVPPGRLAEALISEGARFNAFRIHGKYDIKAVFDLSKVIKDGAIDIVHSHDRRADLIGALAARLAGVRAVTTVHDRINMDQSGRRTTGVSSRMYCMILRRAFAKIITVSAATREDVIDQVGCKAEDVVHIVNGMDLERLNFRPDKEKIAEEIGIEKDKKIVGFVARLRGENFGKKGITYFMEAASSIVREFEGVRFVVVGLEEESERKLKELARLKGVAKYFDFIRYRRSVLDIMSLFSVIVLPSLFEGLPRSLMEGMALGIPAVATGIDGVKELIEDDKSGLLIKPADSEELAAAILRILHDENLAGRLSKAGRLRIAEHFNGRVMAKETGELYKGLMKYGSQKIHSTK